MVRLRKITTELEKRAPRSLAEDWDNVGLQVGDMETDIKRVMLSLDVTADTVNEAIDNKIDLIVSHHPAIFKPLSRLVTPNAKVEPVISAVQAGIAIYSMHTNLDKVHGGTSHIVADKLGVKVSGTLIPSEFPRQFKIVTFAPAEAISEIFAALSSQGAGVIGDYSGCSFRVQGTGTFYPGDDSHPFVGRKGVLNEENEVRIEMRVDAAKLDSAVKSMIAVHPYEEVAYDVYPLLSQSNAGLGVVGENANKETLRVFAERCRGALEVQDSIKIIGDHERTIARVAICGGSGGDLIDAAKRAQADVLVTGDIRYHQALEAKSRNLAMLDLGHYSTEIVVIDVLEKWLIAIDEGLEISRSRSDVEPWSRI